MSEFKSKRDAKSRIVWDETPVIHQIPNLGVLKMWRKGEIGGVAEAYFANLASKRRPLEEEIEVLVKEFNIQSGSPFDSGKMPPRITELESGFETLWFYHPSTD